MSDEKQAVINIDEKIVELLKRKIIIQENNNLRTSQMNDREMVAWIKKRIEEKVLCCSNR